MIITNKDGLGFAFRIDEVIVAKMVDNNMTTIIYIELIFKGTNGGFLIPFLNKEKAAETLRYIDKAMNEDIDRYESFNHPAHNDGEQTDE